jgi:endonuclease YncB( thermonuclease family)
METTNPFCHTYSICSVKRDLPTSVLMFVRNSLTKVSIGYFSLNVLLLLILIQPLHVGERLFGYVVGITDGDIISVMHGGRAEEIRLYAIDAPERGNKPSETELNNLSPLWHSGRRSKSKAGTVTGGQLLTCQMEET